MKLWRATMPVAHPLFDLASCKGLLDCVHGRKRFSQWVGAALVAQTRSVYVFGTARMCVNLGLPVDGGGVAVMSGSVRLGYVKGKVFGVDSVVVEKCQR